MLKIFIGYDEEETVAYHVLSHSILRRSSIPVSITPLNRKSLKGIYDRARGDLESTDFSMSRFVVPYLCGYEGFAVFMDCDMLCLGDVVELARHTSIADTYGHSCRVVKHDYLPRHEKKFLGNTQTAYEKKNWSSVILFNNPLCQELTLKAVNENPGLWMHQFKWTEDHRIGSLPKEWNYLVGEDNQTSKDPRLIHFTNGTPCFPEYDQCEYAESWRSEREDMLSYAAVGKR